jgi:hypothetical protein
VGTFVAHSVNVSKVPDTVGMWSSNIQVNFKLARARCTYFTAQNKQKGDLSSVELRRKLVYATYRELFLEIQTKVGFI